MRFSPLLASVLAVAPVTAQSVCPPSDVFVVGASLDAGPQPARVFAGDTNADGNTDLIVVNGSPGSYTVGVLLGAGDGTFAPLVEPVGATTFSSADNIAVGDLNDDGRDDVAVVAAIGGIGNVRVYFSNPDGSLQSPVLLTATTPRSIALADWNGDGITDILNPSFFASTGLGVLLSNGDGTFQPQTGFPVGQSIDSVIPADFNNDGRLDFATAVGVEIFVYLTRPDGSFQFPATSPAANASGLELKAADLNQDGMLDLIGLTGGSVAVYLATGIGTFGPEQFPLSGATSVTAFDIADLDGDTIPDFVVALSTGVLRFYKGNGDGTFLPPVDDVLGGTPTSLAIADFDHSGTLSAAVADASGLTLYDSTCLLAPVLAVQPRSVLANTGSEVALSAGVSLGTPPLTFQWRRDGVALTDGPGVSGSGSPQLTLEQVSPGDIGVYDLQVTNAFGTATSQPAVLSVVPASSDCPGDFNFDGFADAMDILDYLEAAALGCP